MIVDVNKVRRIADTIMVRIHALVVVPVIAFRTIIPLVIRTLGSLVPVDIDEVVMVKSVNSRAIDNGVISECSLNKVAYKQVIA